MTSCQPITTHRGDGELGYPRGGEGGLHCDADGVQDVAAHLEQIYYIIIYFYTLPHLEHENVYVKNPCGVSCQHQQAGQVQHLATAADERSLCDIYTNQIDVCNLGN